MEGALVATFYGRRGGLGRTSALMAVASHLASKGIKVLALEMDLEAPGFKYLGLGDHDTLGLSDFCLARLAGPELSLIPFVQGDGLLRFMSAGTRGPELAERLVDIYRGPIAGDKELFNLVLCRIDHEIAPDIVLIDTHAGVTLSADVAVSIADVLVGFSDTSEPAIRGLDRIIREEQRRRAENTAPPPAIMLAFGPVPEGAPIQTDLLPDTNPGSPAVRAHAKYTRVLEAQAVLRSQAFYEMGLELLDIRRRFPLLRDSDFNHILPYAPWAAVDGPSVALRASYVRLAEAIARAAGKEIGV